MATTEVSAVSITAPEIQVTVPRQSPKQVRKAHATAKLLSNGDSEVRLATIAEALWNVKILRRAKDRYLMAVDSRDLPPDKGWHLVVRGNCIIPTVVLHSMNTDFSVVC